MKKNVHPLISIGIPAYNGEGYIHKTLESLLNQTYTNIEIIVSDDHSTDNTLQIIESFAKKDKRIVLYKQRKNIGELPNYNFVLSKAKGEYFSWCASDDYRHPKNIEILYNLLQEFPEATGSMCNYKNVYKGKTYFVNKQSVITNNYSCTDSLKQFIATRNIICLFALYKISILKKAGGHHIDSRPFFKGSDYVTIFRAILRGKMVYTPKVLLYKVDTGLFTKRFEAVEKNLLHSTTLQKIQRYLLTPVYYSYDLYYSLANLVKSNIPIFDKGYISIVILLYYFFYNVKFIFTVLKGFFAVLKGLFTRLRK